MNAKVRLEDGLANEKMFREMTFLVSGKMECD